MSEMKPKRRLALLLAVVCVSMVQLAMTINDDEIAALQAIAEHYPTPGTRWGTGITKDVCNRTFLFAVACHTTKKTVSTLRLDYLDSSTPPPTTRLGNISGVRLYHRSTATVVFFVTLLTVSVVYVWTNEPRAMEYLKANTPAPTAPLGNISGLTHLKHLVIGSAPILSIDDWYMQLPSLQTLEIRKPSVTGFESAFTANFTNNPSLRELKININATDLYSHRLIASDSLTTVELETHDARYFPSTFLQGAKNITYLKMTASLGPEFPHINAPALVALFISSPELASFPSNLDLATNLTSLEVSGSSKIQKLPAAIPSLTQLTLLDIRNMKLDLADSIPSLNDLQNLHTLHMLNCSVSSIPDSICSTKSTQTISIDFTDNPITSIPSCIGNLKLGILDLRGTKLTSLPSNIFSSTSLNWISIANVPTLGQSSVVLPGFIDMPNLYHLGLEGSALKGTFPPQLRASKAIYAALLSGNQLTGTLPNDLFARSLNWGQFHVDGNNLSGPFPSPLSSDGSCKLYSLRLGGNGFTTLHSDVLKCWNIRILDLSDNPWVIYKPLSVYPTRFPNLYDLNVAFNRRLSFPESALPTFFAEASSKIERLNMSGCGFTGSVPELQTSNLLYLDLSRKNLTGTLDLLVSLFWTNLMEFDVSHNQLSGSFPPRFSDWRSLSSFKASNNQLSGTIPPLPQGLTTLWLDGNPGITLCPINPDLETRQFDSCRVSVNPQPKDDAERQCWAKYEAIGCTLVGRGSPTSPTSPVDTSPSPPLPSAITLSFTTILMLTWLALTLH